MSCGPRRAHAQYRDQLSDGRDFRYLTIGVNEALFDSESSGHGLARGLTHAAEQLSSASSASLARRLRRALRPGLARQQDADLLEELLGQARLHEVGIAASHDGALG